MAQPLGIVPRRQCQPRVIAEVLGGIILGPTAVGRISGWLHEAHLPLPVAALPLALGQLRANAFSVHHWNGNRHFNSAAERPLFYSDRDRGFVSSLQHRRRMVRGVVQSVHQPLYEVHALHVIYRCLVLDHRISGAVPHFVGA